MRKELTSAKDDWFSMKNDIFKKDDVIIIHQRIVVEAHPEFPDRKDVGKVLAEPGDHLVVVGADCIGCLVKNKTHPEMNFEVPPDCPKGEEWWFDCWHLFDVSATLTRDEAP